MSENIKERLLEIMAICKAKYSSPESIAALQRTFQSHNITIEDWNSLIEYVKTAIDTGNDLIEIIDLVGEYVIQTVEDKMEEVDNSIVPHLRFIGSENITEFIRNNNIINDFIIITGVYAIYIGSFNGQYSQSQDEEHPEDYLELFGFEFEKLGSSDRFVYHGPTLTDPDLTFNDIFSNTYKENYEIQNNKATVVSSSSTDTEYPTAKAVHTALTLKEDAANKTTTLNNESTHAQYPSAKVVWDYYTNALEVAEGKCKTFILSYQSTIAATKAYYTNNSSKVFYVYNGETGELENKTSELLAGAYDDILIQNNAFNSQDALYNIYGGYLLVNPINYADPYNVSQASILYPIYNSPIKAFKKGDIFLVVETDVPDRWFDSNYTFGFYKLETSKVDLANYYTASQIALLLAEKQANLVSGTNIKTINGQSVLGSGDLSLFEEMNDTTDVLEIMEDDEDEEE